MPDQAVPTYRDLVRATAKKYKVPESLALAVVDQESRGTHQPAAGGVTTSPQGARGMFQLLPSTAYGEFGLNADDPAQNIEAGVRYLRQGIERTNGDTRATLAYYHGGPDLKLHGPKTQAYVDAIMGGAANPAAAAPASAPGSAAAIATPPPPPGPGLLDPARYKGTPLEHVVEAAPSYGKFLSEATQSLNPVNIYKGIKTLATTDPRDTARGLWNASAEPFAEGDYLKAVPLIGPRMAESREFFKEGEYARGLGAAADVAAQVFGPKALKGVKGRTRVLPRAFPPRLNPAEAAAVKLGQTSAVPIDVATASGSPFALKLQRAVEATPAGSPHAERAALARGEAMPALGERVAGGVHPQPVSPELAGRGLQQGVQSFIEQRHSDANAAYDWLRHIEADPQFTTTVQTGTRTITSPILGPNGQPLTTVVPVLERMQLPVDLRVVKTQLRPLYDRLRRQLPVTQQEASPGLRALQNVMDGPDFAPATQVDIDLGTIKSLARGADLPQLRDISQGVAAQGVAALSDAVDQAVQRAGPAARQALDEGRAATRVKHAAAEVFDKLREEPVQAFKQTIQAGDTGIDYLRELQALAPQEIPKVGRAVLEDLFSTATAEGGWKRATGIAARWQKLGPETKTILFGPAAPELDTFFTLGKMLERTPNPSGTALTLTGVGSAWAAIRHPLTGGAALLAAGKLAKIMHDPKWVRRLTEGLTIPAGTAQAAAWSSQILRDLGENVESGLAAPPPPPPAAGAQVGTPPPRRAAAPAPRPR